jgi:hypothetical protein
MGKKSKKQPPGNDEDGDEHNMVFRKINTSIKAIEEKIQAVALYLISIQTNKIIGDASPIDEENALNIQQEENAFNAVIEYSKELDDEYDRFMAEVEVSEKALGNS